MTPEARRALGSPVAARSLAGAAVAALVGLALFQRWPAFAPRSLWLDDLWVGVVVREMGLREWFAYRPPIPLGFVGLLKAAVGALGPGEWQLQLVPLLCGLLVIPAVALLTFQLSRSLALAVVAGALAALDPLVAEWSLRVKQYSCDLLAATVVLYCAVRAVAGRDVPTERMLGTYRTFVVAAVLATGISFSAAFVAAPAFAVVTALAWRAQRARAAVARAFWMWAAVFPVWLASLFAVLVSGQRNSGMLRYWARGFLPLDGLDAALDFLATRGAAFFTGAFPDGGAWLAWGVPLGIAALLARRETRWFAALGALFYLQAVVLAALKLYPLGGGRIDAYSHAVTIPLAALGLRALAPARALPWLAVAALGGLLWLGHDGRSHYPNCHDRQAVEHLNAAAAPGDGIVLHPDAGYAIAFYGRWPTELIREPTLSNGFCASARRPDVVLLPAFVGEVHFERDAAILEPALEAFLAGGYRRVHYLGAHLRRRSHRSIVERIREHGYAVAARYDEGDAAHYVFEREAGAGAEGETEPAGARDEPAP